MSLSDGIAWEKKYGTECYKNIKLNENKVMNYRVIKIEDNKIYYDFENSFIYISEEYLIMVYDNECKDKLLGLFPCKDYCLIRFN